MFVAGSFGFNNSVEKLCDSWALSFNKRVRVWACKIRKPHTHVFVPMSHKAFSTELRKPKSANDHLPRWCIIFIGKNKGKKEIPSSQSYSFSL